MGSILLSSNDSLISAVLTEGNITLTFNQPFVLSNRGKYNIEITTKNGCKDIFEFNLPTDVNFPQNTFDYNHINFKNPISKISTTSNQGSVSYEWKNNIGFISNSSSLTVNIGGTYFLTSTSDKGCISYDTLVIKTDTVAPNFNFEIPDLSCNNSLVTPKVLFEDRGLSYTWNGPNKFSTTNKTTLLNIEGNYLIEATNSNGCQTSKYINVEKDNRLPGAIVNDPDILNCKTLMIDKNYTSTSGLNDLKWFGQNLVNSDAKTISISKPGKYYLTGSHPESGCKDTFEFSINQNLEKPTFTISNQETLNCKVNSIEKIVTTSNGLVEWKQGNNVLNEDSKKLKFEIPGLYKILVTHNLSHSKDSLDFKIFSDTLKPNFDIIFDSITCRNNNSRISFNSIDQYDYSFTQNDIIKVNSTNYVTSLGGIKNLTGIGKNGCMTSKSIEIFVNTLSPIFNCTSGDIDCKDNPVNLVVNLNNPQNNIAIYEDNNILTTSSSLLIKAPTSLKVMVKDSTNGCQATEIIIIKKIENSPAGLKFILPFNCESYSKQYQFQKVEKVLGNYKLYIDDVILNEKELLSLPAGMYKISLIDEQGCKTSEEFEIPNYKRPQIDSQANIEINYGEKLNLM
jgi:hypothetical protein